MTGPNWRLEDDLQTVTVTFPTYPPVALALDVAGVEHMLKNLGEFRALMKPEISKSFAPGQTVEVIHNPAWLTEPDAMFGNSLLHLRDPCFGWLHYMIPREEAEKLAGFLQKQVDAPPPGHGQGKPN